MVGAWGIFFIVGKKRLGKCKHIEILAFSAQKIINAYMKNFDFLHFFTKNNFQSVRIIF